MNSILDNIKTGTALQAIVMNNDTEGKGLAIDTRGFDLTAILVQIGISGDTLSGSLYITPKLQESDDTTDGNFTDVAAADYTRSTLSLVDDPAEDDVHQRIEYLGDKRYVRLFLDTTGTHTNGTPVAASYIQARNRVSPISAS